MVANPAKCHSKDDIVQTQRRVYDPESFNKKKAEGKCGIKEKMKMKCIGEFIYLWLNRITFSSKKKLNVWDISHIILKEKNPETPIKQSHIKIKGCDTEWV